MEQDTTIQNLTANNVISKNSVQTIFIVFLFLLFLGLGYLFYQNSLINKRLFSLENLIKKSVSTPTPEVKTIFRSEINKFELMLPTNWYGHEADQLRDSWFSYPVDNFSTTETDPNSKVIAMIVSSIYTAQNSIQEDLEQKSINLFDPNKIENITFGGRFGYFAVSNDQKYAIILIDNGELRYFFTLSTSNPSIISVFKQIILSIKFNN